MELTWQILDDVVSEARGRLEAGFPDLGGDARPVGVGWATVESERAEAELSVALGDRLGSFDDAPDDRLLGARCRIAAGGLAAAVVILEPMTEGRLAGALARLGEGPVAVWFTLTTGPRDGLSAPADGPFGPERLVVGGGRDARQILLLGGEPGTIAT